MNKQELRNKAKDIRKALNIEKISHDICTKIRKMDIYKSAQNVMIFYPMKYEISLLELLEDEKNFYLPKIFNPTGCHSKAKFNEILRCAQNDVLVEESHKNLFVCPYSKNLKKSELGIYEPCSNPVNPEILDLIFVPALMVDEDNYRLGYGGGFYDRFLAQYNNIKTIVPIAKELIIEKLPQDKWDIRTNYIINEKEEPEGSPDLG